MILCWYAGLLEGGCRMLLKSCMSCFCLFSLLRFFSLEYKCKDNYNFSVVSTIGLLTIHTDFVKAPSNVPR